MKKTRIKQTLRPITTRDQAESVLNDLALVMNNQRLMLSRRDAEILSINSKYEPCLSDCATAVQNLTTQLSAWAEANPDQFPKDRKSLEMLSGKLGFRTGTPKLVLLSRAFTWEKVTALLRSAFPGFIRTKEEVDKESILGQYSQSNSKPDFDTNLKQVGLKIIQDESFFVEPDLTKFETRQTTSV